MYGKNCNLSYFVKEKNMPIVCTIKGCGSKQGKIKKCAKKTPNASKTEVSFHR